MLCDIDGCTYEDAAKQLGVPVGTIKSRLYNAKKELALKLQDLLQKGLLQVNITDRIDNY